MIISINMPLILITRDLKSEFSNKMYGIDILRIKGKGSQSVCIMDLNHRTHIIHFDFSFGIT